ncbi:MAG TPA: zinc-dependent alcohol dehydrogenase family protein [Mycobacteriales bacterium]|nr:zinc-dependent alcohol dehydrogenase family protein [Mycobacteriales bacterium]
MRAWWVEQPGPVAGHPMRFGERESPRPGPGELLVRVRACGVCRTDLHLAEGDLPPKAPGTIPGHEVVGKVEDTGAGTTRFRVGDRVGIAWLRRTCGACRFCLRGAENLCLAPEFTGWDADGGYADRAVVAEDYAHALPDAFDDEHAAPLLCAGIIGFRALRQSGVRPGERLGIYGFGASAHLAAQVARAQGVSVHVFTRSASARALALELGVATAADPMAAPAGSLDAALLFAPVGTLVPVALAALDSGGTLAVAGIHLSAIPPLDYRRELFGERVLRSVTANTREDATEFLALAGRLPLEVRTRPYRLEEADAALRDLAAGQVAGAAVLLTE